MSKSKIMDPKTSEVAHVRNTPASPIFPIMENMEEKIARIADWTHHIGGKDKVNSIRLSIQQEIIKKGIPVYDPEITNLDPATGYTGREFRFKVVYLSDIMAITPRELAGVLFGNQIIIDAYGHRKYILEVMFENGEKFLKDTLDHHGLGFLLQLDRHQLLDIVHKMTIFPLRSSWNLEQKKFIFFAPTGLIRENLIATFADLERNGVHSRVSLLTLTALSWDDNFSLTDGRMFVIKTINPLVLIRCFLYRSEMKGTMRYLYSPLDYERDNPGSFSWTSKVLGKYLTSDWKEFNKSKLCTLYYSHLSDVIETRSLVIVILEYLAQDNCWELSWDVGMHIPTNHFPASRSYFFKNLHAYVDINDSNPHPDPKHLRSPEYMLSGVRESISIPKIEKAVLSTIMAHLRQFRDQDIINAYGPMKDVQNPFLDESTGSINMDIGRETFLAYYANLAFQFLRNYMLESQQGNLKETVAKRLK